jgi:hypothetical protein
MLRLPFTTTVPRFCGNIVSSIESSGILLLIPNSSSTFDILSCKSSKEFSVPAAVAGVVSFEVMLPFWLYVQVLVVDALTQFSHGAVRSHLSFLCRHRKQDTTGLGRLRGLVSFIMRTVVHDPRVTRTKLGGYGKGEHVVGRWVCCSGGWL